MKTASLFLFCLLILVSSFYFYQKEILKNNSMANNETSQKLPKRVIATFTPNDNSSDGRTIQSQPIAQIKIEEDKLTKKEVIKVFVPKGKRLYDEEKMNEIATNANIEYLQVDNR